MAMFAGVDLTIEFSPAARGATIYVPTDFPTIQEAIDAAIPGDTVYVYSGTYQEQVIVNKTVNLVGEDKINTIIDGLQQPGDVVYLNASLVSVTGFTITKGEGGVHVFAGQNNSISSNHFVDNGFGIILEGSLGNHITDNNVTSMMYGIFLTSSTSNHIEGNAVTNNGDNGIYLSTSSDNDLVDNRIYNNFAVDGIYLSSSDNNDILNNAIFSNTDTQGIHLLSSSNNNLIGNNLTSNLWGFHLESSSNNLISTNTVSNSGQSLVLELSSDSNEIFDNEVQNSDYSIIIDSSSNNNIVGNNVSDNNYGILLSGSSSNEIVENTVTDNDSGGIYLYGSNSNNITNNQLTRSGIGIHLLSGSADNIITNNTVYNNPEGIRLESSSLNRIYHNDIMNNGKQAYDDTNNSNQWDNGYPSGGNYWSDFDEPSEWAYDDYNGLDQLIWGRDGIVDNGSGAGGGKNPYIIDPDSQDNYPLIGPYKNYMILKQGWNLISIPLIQSITSLALVLEPIKGKYDAVQWYSNRDNIDPWKHHKVGKPYGNDLFEINESMGFWIHITQPGDTIFIYNGTQPIVNQSITIHPGWNLVGYPSMTSYNRTNALNNLTFDMHIDAILTFDARTKKWMEIKETDYFEVGRGYWIHAKTDCVWEVPL